MIEVNEPKVVVIFGDDLHDVAQYIKNTPRKWGSNDSVTTGASHNWDLSTGWQRAWELANTGWTEGALDLSHQLAALPPNEAEPEYTYDVAGYMPDVSLYCAGDPMHMINEGHPQGRQPIVHLVVNVVASGIVSAVEFKNYGAALTAMIGQIEATGRRVELDVVFVDQLFGSRGLLGWKVKRASDNTDLSAVAYSVAHPAAFRRIGFALIERLPRAWQTPGYGMPGAMTKDLAHYIDADGAFLLNGIGTSFGTCKTMAGALKLAATQINSAAGEELVTVNE